jgi:hypothetical protein
MARASCLASCLCHLMLSTQFHGDRQAGHFDGHIQAILAAQGFQFPPGLATGFVKRIITGLGGQQLRMGLQ